MNAFSEWSGSRTAASTPCAVTKSLAGLNDSSAQSLGVPAIPDVSRRDAQFTRAPQRSPGRLYDALTRSIPMTLPSLTS
jgi:hypothetical protein